MSEPTRFPFNRHGATTWWRRNWIGLFLGLYYVGTVAVGVTGLVWAPSPAVSDSLGGLSFVYSVSMAVLGVAALVALWGRKRRAEAAAIVAIALLSVLHGAMVWLAFGDQGVQSGIRIAQAVLMMVPVAYWRAEVALTRGDILRHAREAGHD